MKRSITYTPAFNAAINAYALEHGLSWGAACVTLSAQALGFEGEAVGQWGGKRETIATRCMCGESARFGEGSITCAVCGKEMF